ncbi:helix-turn-helix domain-containing protein [Paenibacillus sinopodophylli]|uniref:helix-turn-helix domain-containing protein n=1 Tax=Paenibacillus sinopodophylli TaxID=1837342 RepID=UPI00110CA2CA|nr:helix-turn-helix transcriptional regulator [Paenibacillus sinopodophylli]
MSLGQRIREQRRKLGLTQPQLAETIGMSLNTIKQLEIGRVKPSIDTLEKLSNLFGVTSDYLLGRKSNYINIEIQDEYIKLVMREIGKRYSVDIENDSEIKEAILASIESWINNNKDT